MSAAPDNKPFPRGLASKGRFHEVALREGRAVHRFSDARQERTLQLQWPTTWLALELATKGLHLQVKRSAPGLAAESLILAVGSVADLVYIASPDILRRLRRAAGHTGKPHSPLPTCLQAGDCERAGGGLFRSIK